MYKLTSDPDYDKRKSYGKYLLKRKVEGGYKEIMVADAIAEIKMYMETNHHVKPKDIHLIETPNTEYTIDVVKPLEVKRYFDGVLVQDAPIFLSGNLERLIGRKFMMLMNRTLYNGSIVNVDIVINLHDTDGQFRQYVKDTLQSYFDENRENLLILDAAYDNIYACNFYKLESKKDKMFYVTMDIYNTYKNQPNRTHHVF